MSQVPWTCPACQAMNTDQSGHCAGCGARIDLDVIAPVRRARTGLAGTGDDSQAARPVLVTVAVALMIASYLPGLRGAFEPEAAPQLLGNLLQGLLLGALAVGVYRGIDWVRKLYMAFQVLPAVAGIWMGGSATISALLYNWPWHLGLLACFILFLPSVRAWFQRR